MSRADTVGMFWNEPPKSIRSAKVSTPKTKALPPPLQIKLPPTKPPKVYPPPDLTKVNKPQAIMDIECYSNYFLIKFMDVIAEKTVDIEMTSANVLPYEKIKKILAYYEVITFNGNRYDIPMLNLAMKGASNLELKAASDSLIKNKNMTVWAFERHHKIVPMKIDHIDLIELTKGVVSLKIYGGRLHCKKMQDLPIEEHQTLTDEEMTLIAEYCGNDLRVTKLIMMELWQQIEIRRGLSTRYKMDLRSKSDAQIAETALVAEIVRKKDGKKLPKINIPEGEFFYKAPDFIKLGNPALKRALEIVTTQPFIVTHDGRIEMPKDLVTLKVAIGSSVYQMGMGGLHSTESATYHVATEEMDIYDWDVASYYPSIILACKLYPEQLGPEFLSAYQEIVTERLEAKRAGNKILADLLKIVVNGSFGKLGSPYSALYSPDLMVQVTVTGQLALLMLIDMMEKYGIAVVSGNTDGIVIKCPTDKVDTMQATIEKWERRTGFAMEKSKYVGIYSRDVNNYIAIKEDGSVKMKGCFSPASLDKNPQNEVCSMAMIEYLKFGTPFEDTIRNCEDITKFITVRSVAGGAMKDKQYLGRAVRWYIAKGAKGAITSKTNGNQVALSAGAKPLMELPESFPDDIDYSYYIKACRDLF